MAPDGGHSPDAAGGEHIGLELSRMGSWDLDLRTFTVTWSRSIALLAGVSGGEGRSSYDALLAVVHADDRHVLMAAVERASVAGVDFEHQFRVISPDGVERWIETAGHVVPDRAGQPARLVGIAIDMTEERRAREAHRASHRLETVGRLAGGIAQDFNNLLTGILGHTELLIDELEGDQKIQRHLEEIRRAGQQAAGLTQQLLAFGRRQALLPRLVNLNAVVTDAVPAVRRLMPKSIELVMDLEPLLSPVRLDPHQLVHVLLNLAVNAKDAMASGGRLRVATANVEIDQEYARAHHPMAPGPYVMVVVEDSGAGMDADTQARVFEPFFSTKGEGTGRGLGLPVVYGIVKQSGGFVWIDSAPGQGTRVRIYFQDANARERSLTQNEPGSFIHPWAQQAAPVAAATDRVDNR